MITLTVYHPTQQFMKFLDKNKFEYSVETVSGYPNREGKHEPGIVHVYDYPHGTYDDIIGLGSFWHSTPQEIEQMGKEMGLTLYQIKIAIERGIETPLGLRRIARNIPVEGG